MISAKRKLLEIFAETSFKSSAEPTYRLASGKLSRYYVDCKQALSDPRARALIGQLVLDLVRNQSFDSVGGLELGAYPVATSVSDAIFQETSKIVRAFVIRKTPKSHGVKDLVAGHTEKGDTALIVDDVVTTGGSTIQAIRSAREAGLIVNRAIVLVDRQEEDGKRNIESEGVTFDSLMTLSELRDLKNESVEGADPDAYRGASLPNRSGSTLLAR
jgi:orotate phosphoribosyltransferase